MSEGLERRVDVEGAPKVHSFGSAVRETGKYLRKVWMDDWGNPWRNVVYPILGFAVMYSSMLGNNSKKNTPVHAIYCTNFSPALATQQDGGPISPVYSKLPINAPVFLLANPMNHSLYIYSDNSSLLESSPTNARYQQITVFNTKGNPIKTIRKLSKGIVEPAEYSLKQREFFEKIGLDVRAFAHIDISRMDYESDPNDSSDRISMQYGQKMQQNVLNSSTISSGIQLPKGFVPLNSALSMAQELAEQARALNNQNSRINTPNNRPN